jgi:hypothetical protein
LVAPEEDQRRIQAASVTFVTDGISGNSCIARRHAAAPCMRRMHDRGDPVGHLQMVIPVAIGFPWFEADDYSALRDLFSDGDRLPPTFEAWHAGAREALRLFQEQGLPVVQVRIEPNAFHVWCTEHAARADYRARHQFVTEIARAHAC